jgi:4-amino-4-deoxy-L-arabinose transferase-like glycosyltransferase
MSLKQVLIGLVVAALVVVAWLAWQTSASRRARRHARSTIPLPATELRWEQDPEGDSPPSSLPADYVDSIRRDAEDTARYITEKGLPEPANPYPPGSRECVLWAASFHMTMTELEEMLGETQPSSDPMPLENPPPHAQRPHTQPPSVPPGISRQ